ncbi:MAG: hypothetical protein DIZ80_13370 [endosymbiont of Galathealinum brachiosum]|uniref:Uncharacterized protein n=1 Tax=endosymbiont of Galathealinum brachiosum TaxID=2200906 RepID=A0A370D863_9GAMM|nr:MAG: hypothetical protein DIZ80_13370 [endosymbiont of Galathealinum brachiosum]
MQKRTRLATFGVILLSSSILFTASTKTANAWFFDPFENMVDQSLATIENLITTLSNDIGTMADRILLMSDDIGLMADRIGEMADRIVHTEEMILASTTDSGISSVITYPTEGTVVNSVTPVNITLSSQNPDYILYISNNADMSGSTNALVQNNDTSIAWSRVTDFATGNKLYIAVRTTNSEYSNTVMLNLQ